MVRIYWNISTAQDGLVWSIDDGDQKNEVHVKEIISHSVTLKTNQDLTAEWPHPKGWLESKEAIFLVRHNEAHVYLKATKIF